MSTTPRKNPEDRQRQILDAAVDLFYEHGYQKASLRDISRRVEVTQAAIYYHFQSKEEILYAIIDEFSNRLHQSLKDTLALDLDLVEKLRKVIRAHLGFMETDYKSVKILIEDKRFLSGELASGVRKREKDFFNLYVAYLGEMKEAGFLRDISLTPAAFGIFGQINWLYHWYRPNGKQSIQEMAEGIIRMIFYGLVRGEGS